MEPVCRLMVSMVAILGSPTLMVAETHRFTPTVYYPTYSFAHPPALRIKPGDRVITRTIDAGGNDENGNRSRRSERIRRLVRSSRRSGARGYAGRHVRKDPDEPARSLLRQRPAPTRRPAGASAAPAGTGAPRQLNDRRGEGRRAAGESGPAARVMELRSARCSVRRLTPARKEPILSTTTGPWGGNMDYNGLTSGVKVMLPSTSPALSCSWATVRA